LKCCVRLWFGLKGNRVMFVGGAFSMLDADVLSPGVGYTDRVLPLCSGVLLSGPFTAGIADVSY